MSDLQAERERTRRLVKRTSPASLMSDTKWRNAFAVLQDPVLDLETVWVKFLDAEGEKAMNLAGVGLHPPRAFIDSFEFGPFELNAIEWLRVPADRAARTQDALAKIGRFTFDQGENGIRIIGHRV